MVVYTRATCAPCRTLKYLLNKKNVSYEERDIDVPEYAEEARKLGVQVPIVVEGDQSVVGFNMDAVYRLINIAEA